LSRRALATAALAAMAIVGVAACGSDGGGGYVEPTGPPVDTIAIKGHNFAFEPKNVSAPPGVIEIDLESEDNLHTLVIEGIPGFQLEATGGGSDSGKVDLEKGKYTFYCDIPGHRAQGMEGTITVR
jgi:plastocyanin